MWLLPPVDTSTDGSSAVTLVLGRRLRRVSTLLASAVCDDVAGQIERIQLAHSGPYIKSRGLDGADWVFERLDSRGHTALVRWSPDCSTECDVFTTGMAFPKAARALPSGPREMY